MPCGPEALKAAGYERIFSEKVMSPSPRHTHQPTVLRPKGR
jgi:hypothetical protein